MKYLLSTILAATACVMMSWAENSADVLVWYVDTSEDAASYDGATRSFDTIKFWAVDAEGKETGLAGNTYTGPDYLLAGTPAAGSGNTIQLSNDDAPTTIFGSYYTSLSGFESGYSFYMELYLGDDRVDRMLEPLSWSDFQDYMVASSGLANDLNLEPAAGLYNAASTMVPEPSSGLLLVIGGALLALRRRRQA